MVAGGLPGRRWWGPWHQHPVTITTGGSEGAQHSSVTFRGRHMAQAWPITDGSGETDLSWANKNQLWDFRKNYWEGGKFFLAG